VLQNDLPIARVNGADVLARLAGVGQEEVADALVEILNDDKQNRAVKYHAVRGLERLFALGPPGKDTGVQLYPRLAQVPRRQAAFYDPTAVQEVDGFRWVAPGGGSRPWA